MRIILSRKGFDSSYGGVPSPIMEDGKIMSLPIPSQNDEASYGNLHTMGFNVGKIVEDLTKGKINKEHRAHLDPDICFDSYKSRPAGWRGLFGQCNAAQGHLKNQKVTKGDIFLFYGYFQRVKQIDGHYRFDKNSRLIHLIWGWLQIDDIIALKSKDSLKQYQWAEYHPHNNYHHVTNNTLYIATDKLTLNGKHIEGVKGYGLFPEYRQIQQLTEPDAIKRTDWRLPGWMYRTDKKLRLTYHANREWVLKDGYAYLKSCPIGQEFVFDCTNDSQAIEWLYDIFG